MAKPYYWSMLLLRCYTAASASFALHGPTKIWQTVPVATCRRPSSTGGGGHTNHESHSSSDDVPPLRYLGDAQLMQRQPIFDSNHIAECVDDLEILRRAMEKYGGIGIAAPQIGWWTRVFCFGIAGNNPRYPQAQEIPFSFWINPEMVVVGKETNWMWEGCLSVPGMRGWVERPARIILKGYNERGEWREESMGGLAARVAQHEYDHLDGILFPQKVPNASFLVPQASMDARDGWGDNWPSPGSCKTKLGELSDEK